ncbi:MAG TPA: PfkB family carbohydrate kinase [Longimicrobiales bacterium]
MSLLVVGSVALDTVETPFGRTVGAVGGSATYFGASASLFHPVQLVGVVGRDYPLDALSFLTERGVDLSGLVQKEGESFRWSGFYGDDLNAAHTRETRLGVFAEFRPEIPESFRGAEWVFLANIDPELQLDVLGQIAAPRFVACDTMDFWIDGKREALLELLGRVDALLINDGEVRRLTGDPNLLRAARWVQARGPRIVVVKKGEHGAMLVTPETVFFVPGYPLEEVFDPTGAGDSFAGGFMGHLARAASTEPEELRRAVVCGAAMGSFAVERFSVERLVDLTPAEVQRRVRAFHELTAFEQPLPAGANG